MLENEKIKNRIDNIHHVLQEYINLISDSINNPNSVELLIEIEKIFMKNKQK